MTHSLYTEREIFLRGARAFRVVTCCGKSCQDRLRVTIASPTFEPILRCAAELISNASDALEKRRYKVRVTRQ